MAKNHDAPEQGRHGRKITPDTGNCVELGGHDRYSKLMNLKSQHLPIRVASVDSRPIHRTRHPIRDRLPRRRHRIELRALTVRRSGSLPAPRVDCLDAQEVHSRRAGHRSCEALTPRPSRPTAVTSSSHSTRPERRSRSTTSCSLARDGFYDGLTFHRIVDDFVIQGCCPEGTVAVDRDTVSRRARPGRVRGGSCRDGELRPDTTARSSHLHGRRPSQAHQVLQPVRTGGQGHGCCWRDSQRRRDAIR